ncbi:hypothetical protein HDU77_006867 [Chytriomyces hyalinus]|nr:hypothetical protein HDU77_006867 [Chytriomyces hyalinus]
MQQQEGDFSDVNDSFYNDNELYNNYDHGNEEEEADSNNKNTSKDGNHAEESENDDEWQGLQPFPPSMGGENLKRIKADNTVYILSPEEKEAGRLEVEAAITKLNLKHGMNSVEILGYKNHASNSVKNLSVYVNALYCLGTRIGDFESLIMLDKYPTEGLVPSISARLISLVIKWKHSEAGTFLLEQNGTPVLDLKGDKILFDGK